MANGTGVKTPNVVAAARASRGVYSAWSLRKIQKAARQIGTMIVTATPKPCSIRGTPGFWRRAAKARAKVKYNTVTITDPIAITENSRDVLRIASSPTEMGRLHKRVVPFPGVSEPREPRLDDEDRANDQETDQSPKSRGI